MIRCYEENKISLDSLIGIVENGGKVKTGIDIYNKQDILILEKNVLVEDVNILLNIKKSGILEITVHQDTGGGVWDPSGEKISFDPKSVQRAGKDRKTPESS